MRAVGIGPTSPVHAATDITGFGLLGHLSHVARASNVTIHIDSSAVPLHPRVREMALAGFTTGGGDGNARYIAPLTQFADTIAPDLRDALVDPQTSGGLCIAVDPASLNELLRELLERGVETRAVIGSIAAPPSDSDAPWLIVH
jgi:selenide,water dikinase